MCLNIGVTILDLTIETKLFVYCKCTVYASSWIANTSM